MQELFQLLNNGMIMKYLDNIVESVDLGLSYSIRINLESLIINKRNRLTTTHTA